MPTGHILEPHFESPLRAVSYTVAAQVIGLGAGLFARSLAPTGPASAWDSIYIAGVHALTSWVIAKLAGLPSGWRLLNFVLPFMILWVALVDISGILILSLAALTLLLYLPSLFSQVPFFPTATKAYDEILKLLPEDREFRFIDLGCGSARLLRYLASRRPRGRFEGVEIGPLPFLLSRIGSLGHRNISIGWCDFWRMSLKDYDFVYAFLAPPVMQRLSDKVRAEMRPQSLFISNAFPAPISAKQEIDLGLKTQARLYLYEP